MLFECTEIVDAIKQLASADRASGRSHCQLLNLYAEQLGYQSYQHLTQCLEALPSDRFGKVSLRLMRHICAVRLPSLNCDYCYLTAFNDRTFGYYSHWIGWDKEGRDVRVVSPLDGMRAVRFREFLNHPVYVVESDNEWLAWQFNWRAGALMPEPLARRHFASFFDKKARVVKNPPRHKLEAEAARRRKYLDSLFLDPAATGQRV
jgi:hypothetical protein